MLKYKYNDSEGEIAWEQPLIATADNILWHVSGILCYTKQLSKKHAMKMQFCGRGKLQYCKHDVHQHM